MKTNEAAGPLVIIGGHEDRTKRKVILREFVRLSGGSSARIVLITAASEEPSELDREYRAAFESIGVEEFRGLPAETRRDADRAEAVGIVDRATGIFFTGGDQKRVVRLLHDTKLERALHARRADGLVIGGTSAGASIMSDIMLDDGDSAECPRAGVVSLGAGLGFLPGVLIDQHFAQRGRMGRLLAAVAERPELLGVGVGEDTAMVVEGSTFRTVGAGVVTVIDAARLGFNNFPDAKPNQPLTLTGLTLHTVGAGHAFDISTRTPLPQARPAPIS